MKTLCRLLCLLILAGCGSGGNFTAVTPVMANNRGTYRLANTTVTVVAPGGSVATFSSYSTGTLQLFDDTTYTRTMVGAQTQNVTRGVFLFAGSTSSILASRDGSFSLTPSTATDYTQSFFGSYDVTPDYTLKLTYDQYALPDQSLVTRSNVWIKESDSSHH